MKTLVLFESFFGNTEKVARAIGSALGLTDADVMRVTELKPGQLEETELLIVGSPTRAFQASPDTKVFLSKLASNSLKGKKIAAFDTRAEMTEKTPGFLRFMAGLFGYAAEPIARKLVSKGGTQILAPAGFIVLNSEGPLKEGELERAAAWVREIK
ncbi:MAG: hypothetical protein GYA15_05150 [Leptolinea sp.]|jgi:flavodoxin|nr:hypothetical protein [Leptolinea sp.]